MRENTLGAGLIWSFAAFALLSLVFFMPRDFNLFDEGLIVVDAMRLLRGEVLHRDFYANYGPGQYAAVALMFVVFGPGVTIAKLYGVAVQAAILVAVLFAVRERFGNLMSLAIALSLYFWMLAFPEFLYPVFPCILFSVVGGQLLLSPVRTRLGIPSVMIAGMLTGATALFRYETGAFLMLAQLAAMSFFRSMDRTTTSGPWRADAIKYCAGVAIVFLPFALWFIAVAPVSSFVHDILEYPSKYYAVMRGLPFPGIHAIQENLSRIGVYTPVVALAAAFAWLAWERLMQRKGDDGANANSVPRRIDARRFLVLFAFTGAALFAKGIVRVSPLHMLMAIVPAQLAIAMVVQLCWPRRLAGKFAAVTLAALALVAPSAGAYKQLQEDRYHPSATLGGWFIAGANRATSAGMSDEACEGGPAGRFAKVPVDYARVSHFIQHASQPGEPIFVGLARHDRIFVNAVGVYFLADRPSATHWHQFDPGLQTRADIQQAITAELARTPTRWLVIDHGLDGVREPNASALSSGVRILDDYIRSHYRQVATAGKLHVWLINSEVFDPRNFEHLQCGPRLTVRLNERDAV